MSINSSQREIDIEVLPQSPSDRVVVVEKKKRTRRRKYNSPEQARAAKLLQMKLWVIKHKDEHKKAVKEWKDKHKDEVREYYKKYVDENRTYINQLSLKSYKKKQLKKQVNLCAVSV